ncbi:MAG TPA: c-type cytochrome [Candidatus Eisenbacteria bacterium]|nr:c-type cytochrome [Candidatus Eisenbacteria bacterium]
MPPQIPRAFSFVKKFLQLLLLFAMAGLALWTTTFRPNLNAVERGRRLAEKTGCFGCHGPEGMEGASNPGRAGRTVPSYKALMMFATTEQDVREWIRDGVTVARAKSETWRANRDASALRMPAFGKRLKAREIDDLAAFVMAVSGEEAPKDSLALVGRGRAKELGCTGCHGVDGRYSRPNPGSLKGYIPSWDGPDFPELVRNRQEFDEWVERGNTRRFETNPIAMYFLRRAALHMPAFKRFLAPGDLDALWTHVRWLRTGRPAAAGGSAPAAGSDQDDEPTTAGAPRSGSR